MSKYSANTAAAQTRAEIKRHIKRLRKKYAMGPIVTEAKVMLDELEAFIETMAKRAGKRTGGLGRK